MLNNHTAYKHETPCNIPFVITRCWNSGTVAIKYGWIQIRHNIHHIKPYKFDTKFEDIKPENFCDNVNR